MRPMLLSLAHITVNTTPVTPIENAYNSKGLDEVESPTDMHNSNEIKDVINKSIMNSSKTNHSNQSDQTKQPNHSE